MFGSKKGRDLAANLLAATAAKTFVPGEEDKDEEEQEQSAAKRTATSAAVPLSQDMARIRVCGWLAWSASHAWCLRSLAQDAIQKATSLEEIQRLERLLEAGHVPAAASDGDSGEASTESAVQA
jgi:hypothetical protein